MKHFWIVCLLLASSAFAAPPVLDIPPEIRASGDYVTLSPKTDAVAITYVAQSGVEAFPSAFLKDPRSFVLPVRGLPTGRYRFVAVASKDDEHARVDFAVLIGDAPPVVVVPPGPEPVVDPVKPPVTTKATAATYVTQKGLPVPPAVLAAIDDLNTKRKILATIVLHNTTDGTGDAPEQYKAAFAAAKEAGLPALVVTAGKVVLTVVKNPRTEEDVLKAVP